MMIDNAPFCLAVLQSTACMSYYRNVQTLAIYMHYTRRYTAYLHIKLILFTHVYSYTGGPGDLLQWSQHKESETPCLRQCRRLAHLHSVNCYTWTLKRGWHSQLVNMNWHNHGILGNTIILLYIASGVTLTFKWWSVWIEYVFNV